MGTVAGAQHGGLVGGTVGLVGGAVAGVVGATVLAVGESFVLHPDRPRGSSWKLTNLAVHVE